MTGVPAEGRHEVLAGILTAATVLVVGYASGFGHLLGHLAPPAPFAVAAPQAPAVTVPAAEPPASDGADEPTAAGLAAVTKGTPAAVGGSHHPAAAPATGSTRSAAGPAGSTSSCDPSLVSAVGTPFWVHLQKGHLEESPGQQVSDLLSTDQYVRTHTVLLEDVLSPVVAASSHTTDAAGVFWVHLQKGHLEESPGQQVSDLLSTDQYVTTHTVLVEDLLSPTVTSATGSC